MKKQKHPPPPKKKTNKQKTNKQKHTHTHPQRQQYTNQKTIKKTTIPDAPNNINNENGLIRLITMGKSVRLICLGCCQQYLVTTGTVPQSNYVYISIPIKYN